MSTSSIERTIEQTVTDYLSGNGMGGYARQAQPVIEGLKARERNISEQLLTYAADLGADPEDVRRQLGELGMELPAEEPDEDEEDEEEEDDEAASTVSEQLDRILVRLDSLTAFARRNGYSE